MTPGKVRSSDGVLRGEDVASRVLDPVDDELLRRLRALTIRLRGARRPDPGRLQAHRTPPHATVAQEIQDFRPYRAGDDLRFADWASYLRLGTLLIRRYRQERAVCVHLLLDCSRSMAVPAPDRKFSFAATLTWLLAYVALTNESAVRIVPCSDPEWAARCSATIRPGRTGFASVRRYLASLEPQRTTDLGAAVAGYVARRDAHRGLVLLVSDFLLPLTAVDRALRTLRAAGHEVAAIHVVGAPERETPSEPGLYRLRDAETLRERLLWLSRAQLGRARQASAAHGDELDRLFRRHQVRHARAMTAEAPGAFLLHALPQLDFVR
jgi:uncharacterized protein (DUF58 family)